METVVRADDINPCDLYASHPDAYPVGVGVDAGSIDPDKAIPACEKAIRDFPDLIRFYAQLGRALLVKGRHGDALSPTLHAEKEVIG